jgi:uracil-DNA glycosylase
MTMHSFNLTATHPSWHACLTRGLAKIDQRYLQELSSSTTWLPGSKKIFNAFSQPLENVNYVLFGESPYPRSESANGYAFWDAAVHELWSPTGLSKKINRATSMRNIIKMLLIADDALTANDTSQEAIARINKQSYIQTNDAFFKNLLKHGFLLLNTTPVLQSGPPQKDARAWHPFTIEILDCLLQKKPDVTLILFGRIASVLEDFIPTTHVNKLLSEHPYNVSFINNEKVLEFFKPLKLLRT